MRLQWPRKLLRRMTIENLKNLRREILDSERLRDRARNLLREIEESHGVSDSDAFAPSKARTQECRRHRSGGPQLRFLLHQSVRGV